VQNSEFLAMEDSFAENKDLNVDLPDNNHEKDSKNGFEQDQNDALPDALGNTK
jgi:hypothetical protein